MRHGTRSCYSRLRCRCGPCVEANRAYGRNRTLRYDAGELAALLEHVVAEYGGLRPASRIFAERVGIREDAALKWMSYVRRGHHTPHHSYADRFACAFGRVLSDG